MEIDIKFLKEISNTLEFLLKNNPTLEEEIMVCNKIDQIKYIVEEEERKRKRKILKLNNLDILNLNKDEKLISENKG